MSNQEFHSSSSHEEGAALPQETSDTDTSTRQIPQLNELLSSVDYDVQSCEQALTDVHISNESNEFHSSSSHEEGAALPQETSDTDTSTWQIPQLNELPSAVDYDVHSCAQALTDVHISNESNELPCSSTHQEDSQGKSGTDTFTWQIPKFNELPSEVDYKIDSEQFVFETTSWCIRTYPNGRSKYRCPGLICLKMKRTSTLAPLQDVWCHFGIKNNNGHVKMMDHKFLERYDRKMGPITLLPRSDVCKAENNFLQNGTITMVCRMKYVEEICRKENEIYEIPSSVYDRDQAIGILSTGSQLNQELMWKLDHFPAMPTALDYFVVSPTFEFDDTSCYVRLYPNGRSGDNTEGWICIELEMSDFLARKQPTFCKIGVWSSERELTKERYLAENEKIFGFYGVLTRSCVNNSLFLQDGCLIVICELIAIKPEVESPTFVS